MNLTACRVTERTIEHGFQAVTLENEQLLVTILPEKGADIYQLVYKPRNMDVLWKSPWGLKRPGGGMPTAANSEEVWLEHYEGGWQEIFPNGGDACRYKGGNLNFHGEVSTLPWEYTVERAGERVSIEFRVSTYRSPFILRRLISIEAGHPVLRISEQITNRGEEEMHFMWGHHPAFGGPFLEGDCTIQLPGGVYQAHSSEISPLSRISPGTVAKWPAIPGKQGIVDLSRVPPMTERHCEFGYLRDLSDGWYALTSRKHDFSFGLVWPLEVFPYLWFWQELRGSFGFPWYGGCYVMAVEPFTSIPGTGLENAIQAGTAPVIAPGASINLEMAALFIPGQEKINRLTLDGIVTAE